MAFALRAIVVDSDVQTSAAPIIPTEVVAQAGGSELH